MKLLIVNNLAAGYQEGAIYDFIRAFAQDGDEICMRSTDGTTDFRPFLFDAHAFDAVIASGGDGTVAAVCYQLAGSGVPVLPFPAGTANLLCSNMMLPNETHALAQAVRDMKTMDFDIVEMQIGGRRFGFNLMAGAGYDAAIMRDAEPSKSLLGPVAYFTAAAQNITPQVAHFTIRLDDRVVECDVLGVLIINFPRIQFDIPLAHESDPRDGVLEVAILKAESALGLIPALGAAILDRSGEYPGRSSALEVYQAKSVSIISDPPLHIEYDGEPLEETTPFSAHVMTRAARYVVGDDTISFFGK